MAIIGRLFKPIAGYPDCHLSYDLGDYHSREAKNTAIADELRKLQSACNLSEGQLFRSVHFSCNGIGPDQIFLIAHHLVIDIVSWNSIFSDFLQVLKKIGHTSEIDLKPKTASIRTWGERLQDLANSPEILKELPYWKEQRAAKKILPSDFDTSLAVFQKSEIGRYQQCFDREFSTLLLQQANEAYSTKTEDLLLTALWLAIRPWCQSEKVLIGLERHGRTSGVTSLDVSGTIGWFTAFFPVLLGSDQTDSLEENLKGIKEQLRTLPNEGIGYGILKYLNKDPEISTSLDQEPELIFNYMGVFGTGAADRGTWF